MAHDIDFFASRATAAFDRGFTTKAAQKSALADVAYAFSLVVAQMHQQYLLIEKADRTEVQEDVYWMDLTVGKWNAKTAKKVGVAFPQLGEQFAQLAELAAAIKSVEVVKVAPQD